MSPHRCSIECYSGLDLFSPRGLARQGLSAAFAPPRAAETSLAAMPLIAKSCLLH